MEENLEKKINFLEKLLLFLKKNKLRLFILIFLIFLLILFVIFYKISNDKKNQLISEQYIQAGIYLSAQDENKAKKMYEKIILSKNKFYSILALNTILEKNLETNENKILKYFEILENLNISKEQKDLIILKKALYFIKNSKIAKGKDLLNNLIQNNSKYKEISQEILDK